MAANFIEIPPQLERAKDDEKKLNSLSTSMSSIVDVFLFLHVPAHFSGVSNKLLSINQISQFKHDEVSNYRNLIFLIAREFHVSRDALDWSSVDGW